MFKDAPRAPASPAGRVTLTIDGRRIEAREGDSVALALMKAGVVTMRRTPAAGEPRAPLCLMGVCFECLMDIDGVRNQQSCMVPVRDGMLGVRQVVVASLAADHRVSDGHRGGLFLAALGKLLQTPEALQ